MKKFIIIIAAAFISSAATAQEFNNNISSAKTAYKAGNLEETHFALQKALQELDMIIGKEVLKLLPVKMDSLASNASEDNVSANVGFAGATILRTYGKNDNKAELSVISNSPLVAMLNGLFNNPMLAKFSDGNSKTIKLQGYKARMEKRESGDGKIGWELQVPLGSALISFRIDNATEAEAMAMANTIPLAQVAKLIQ